jgi:hypothetical protein
MKCLLPVFPAGPADRARLLAPFDGEAFFLRAVRALAGHPGLSAVLATGDRDAAELAGPVLPVVFLPEARARDDDFPLPPGTRDCLAALATRDADPQEPLLVCDCRHPFLDGELADRAGAAWDGRRPLVGVRVPEDHPVQLQAHYLLRFADAVVRLDPARPGLPDLDRLARRMLPENAPRPEAYVTRPMAVDWGRHGIGAPATGGPYVLVRGGTGRPWGAIAPLSEVPQSPDVPCDIAAAFVEPAAASARRLVFFPPRQAPAALSFLGGAVPDCLGEDVGGDTRLLLREGLWREGGLLKVAPFAGLRPMPEAAASLWLGPAAGAEACVRLGREYLLTGAVIPKEADGAMITLQTPSFGAETTHTEPAFPETCLWGYDPARRICVDRKSGAPIVGRQLFPDIYELCPAMVLGRGEDLAGLREGGLMAGFPLATPYTLACDDELGFFRCLVRARSEKEARP